MIKIKWKDNKENSMTVHTAGEAPYLSFPCFDQLPFITHGFSTRLGGVSEGDCYSMNLSFARGDRHEAVMENYERISREIGFDPKNIVCSDQTHTTNIRVVTREDRGKGLITPLDYSDIDGLITNEPDTVLATFFADCVPIYLVDPVKKAIGMLHSGWRGTVGDIIGQGLKMMRETYGTAPENVIAGIGPSICGECYEISKDVADEFMEKYPTEMYKDFLVDHHNGKFHLDLWKACRCNLIQGGVKAENIHLPNLCTCCNPELLFSHRASKGKRGNLAAFIMLKHKSGEEK